MIETMKLAFEITMTYSVNGFIYWLHRIPLIKKIIPSDLYQKKDLKDVIRVLVGLGKALWTVGCKFLYVFVFFAWFFSSNPTSKASHLLTIFFFLSLIGGMINSEILSPTKEKYHVVILMKMNAKRYALSHYFTFLGKTFLTYLLSFFVFCLMESISPFLALWIALWVVGIKLLFDGFLLWYYEKNEVILKNKFWIMIPTVLIGLVAAYGITSSPFTIPIWCFVLLFVGTCVGAFFSTRYLLRTNCYAKLYKKTVTMNAIIFDVDETARVTKQKQVDKFTKEISQKTAKKKGYDYFNSIFFERHKKILLNSAIKFSLVYLLMVGIGAVIALYDPQIAKNMNETIPKILPYFVFVMYFTNRGILITQAMFFNCDHSMLTYQFYREPNVILNLFWARLKMLMKINAIPALVLGIGLPLLLFLSGGAVQPIDYGLLFCSILFMSIFFSVHYLVLYYLLQPYDIAMKEKSTTYNMIVSFTYFICYLCLQIKVPLVPFSLLLLSFTILYVLIALYLVYKRASKTFRIRL